MSKIHTIPTFFVVDVLDDGYYWIDFEYSDLEFDYAVDVLEIPEEALENVEYTGEESIEITLTAQAEHILEDWYYALLKHAKI